MIHNNIIMDKLSHDHHNIIMSSCDLATLQSYHTVNKSCRKICIKYILNNFILKIPNSTIAIIDAERYQVYKNAKKLRMAGLQYISKFPRLIHLTFDHHFNQPIKDILPDNLTHLIFGDYLNQSIKDVLPNNLTHLTCGSDFNQSIIDALPSSLLELKICKDYYYEDDIPKNLKTIFY